MEFNHQLETVISSEGEKALSYMWLHDRAQKKYNRLSNFINIPVIVLSTLAGSASIGSESLFPGFPQASVIIGLVSILVGILGTLQSYFNFEKRTEGHKIASIQYYKVYNFIKIELSLPRAQRTNAGDFLKLIKEDLERLKEISPMIPDEVIAEYKAKFDVPEYKDVAKPEICNGLTAIEPFNQAEESKRSSVRLNLEGISPPTPTPTVPIIPQEEIEKIMKPKTEAKHWR
jgi:hypothetical protein